MATAQYLGKSMSTTVSLRKTGPIMWSYRLIFFQNQLDHNQWLGILSWPNVIKWQFILRASCTCLMVRVLRLFGLLQHTAFKWPFLLHLWHMVSLKWHLVVMYPILPQWWQFTSICTCDLVDFCLFGCTRFRSLCGRLVQIDDRQVFGHWGSSLVDVRRYIQRIVARKTIISH